jgi:hypothetical protein
LIRSDKSYDAEITGLLVRIVHVFVLGIQYSVPGVNELDAVEPAVLHGERQLVLAVAQSDLAKINSRQSVKGRSDVEEEVVAVAAVDLVVLPP